MLSTGKSAVEAENDGHKRDLSTQAQRIQDLEAEMQRLLKYGDEFREK